MQTSVFGELYGSPSTDKGANEETKNIGYL
jgi:hypothetical protein